MKTAIVHDWLTGMRGGEKCLEILCELFPDADLYTLLHIKGKMSEQIEGMNIITSFLQKLPFVEKRYRYYLPIMPFAIERFDMSRYDLIISSSHCVAKGIVKRPATCHICYCHTPMRYIWDMYHHYFGNGRLGWLSRKAIPLFRDYLRKWDVSSADRVDYFITISENVLLRIKRHYNRESEIIYPPVNTDFFTPLGDDGDYYLMVTAFAPYKRIDLAIEAFNILGYPLKIIGTGQDEKRLKGIAMQNIEFPGWIPDQEIRGYYARCKAFIFPGEEDFGITPLEAQSAGRPVIAYGKGGALETVIPIQKNDHRSLSPTGVFFYEQTVESLIEAVKYFEDNGSSFNKEKIREHARRFDRSIFKGRIEGVIRDKYEQHMKQSC